MSVDEYVMFKNDDNNNNNSGKKTDWQAVRLSVYVLVCLFALCRACSAGWTVAPTDLKLAN